MCVCDCVCVCVCVCARDDTPTHHSIRITISEPRFDTHVFFYVCQVKKLQMMLRQANDQLERTMAEKQELEESVKLVNEEFTAKARDSNTLTLWSNG